MADDAAALADARAAIDALPRDDFAMLMAYAHPPDALVLVCGAALLAVGMPAADGWKDVQRGLICDPLKFKSAVLALEPADIDSTRLASLSERVAALEATDMHKISSLGAALKAWLKAVVTSVSISNST